METSAESEEDGPVYTLPQIKAAWRLMCRGEKEGLRKRDIERIIRAFRPCTSTTEFEQLVGNIKGRITYSDVRHILTKDSLPKDFDPVLAAFRVFDRDHSAFLSPEELKFYVGQVEGIGKLTEEDMHVVMDLVDVDGDGKVSLDDFRSFITSGLVPPPPPKPATPV